jgi:hypothetical protein
MHITYCTQCGVRLDLKVSAKKDPLCSDCADGKKPKRAGRKGDSARITRRKTSVLIRDAMKNKKD